MKKGKMLIAMLLAVFTVCSLMTVSASAASYSVSDHGSGRGYTWNSSLSTMDSRGTARITVTANSTGVVATMLYASESGFICTDGGERLKVTARDSSSTEQPLTVSATRYPASGDKVVGAWCDFFAMGLQAGSGLQVGTSW